MATTQLSDFEDEENRSRLRDCQKCLKNCFLAIFSTKPRYDDFTFRHGRVIKDEVKPNVYYYRVRRKYDKLPSKVFTDFSKQFTAHIKEIHPQSKAKRKDKIMLTSPKKKVTSNNTAFSAGRSESAANDTMFDANRHDQSEQICPLSERRWSKNSEGDPLKDDQTGSPS